MEPDVKVKDSRQPASLSTTVSAPISPRMESLANVHKDLGMRMIAMDVSGMMSGSAVTLHVGNVQSGRMQ